MTYLQLCDAAGGIRGGKEAHSWVRIMAVAAPSPFFRKELLWCMPRGKMAIWLLTLLGHGVVVYNVMGLADNGRRHLSLVVVG
ncbi:MAG: hypothetical protein NZ901_00335 [Geminocystis sp.]|nr:hypothetical protein [Geminocystis sp.]MCS7146615.1 hypothetical protein [Geminocystis sp.]MCX8077486.1 hypothetical protein [Geminocystis sp.]MDW8462982.1 hypothetical protein [Geminocystis sp.]HIK37582.1 hypothetical protein [Geminocystis sp. M7585_C2015_104]